jgi:hypothetical protein
LENNCQQIIWLYVNNKENEDGSPSPPHFIINLSHQNCFCVQVENRTLQSQSSSLLAQINSLQADYSRLELDLGRSSAKVRMNVIF